MLFVKMIIPVIIDNMGPATESGCIDNPPTPPPWSIRTRHLPAQSQGAWWTYQETGYYTRALSRAAEGHWPSSRIKYLFLCGGFKRPTKLPPECCCVCMSARGPDILYWDLCSQPNTTQLIWHSWENARTGRSTTGTPFSSQITGGSL